MTLTCSRLWTYGPFAGEIEGLFARVTDNGLFQLSDPAMPIKSENVVYTASEEVAVHIIETYGFSLYMRGELIGDEIISANDFKHYRAKVN